MSRNVSARRPGRAARLFRRVRPVLFGALACYFGVRGQSLVQALATRPKATVHYAVAIVLILAAWAGTDRNRDLAPVEPEENPRRWRMPAWRDRAAIFAAIVVNVLAVLHLRQREYDSLGAGAAWLASLVLLAFAAAGLGRKGTDPAAPDSPRGRASRRVDLLLCLLIFLAALAVRVYRIGDWTTGMHGDEGEVGLNSVEILEHPEISPFRTGWFGQPNFYYWGVAIGMKLFGRGLAGLRAFSVAAGALLLIPFYFLVRRLFGTRAAIAASLLLAVSGPAVHFSRQEFSNITTPMLLVAGFLFLLQGLESRRMLPFVLAGYAHLSCLYFYLGGRLTPLIAAAFFAYLLLIAPLAGLPGAYRRARAAPRSLSPGAALAAALRRRFANSRALLPAIAFYAVAAFCMVSPWAAYYQDHRAEWDSRVREKLIFNQPRTMADAHRARHTPLKIALPGSGGGSERGITLAKDGFWPRVVWGQLKATLSILTWNFDRSGVYITLEPATKPFESVLVIFAIAWALWRWRDGRMALLSIWFWMTILVGGVLTIDAPYLARLVGILPVIAIFAAIALDKLALELERLWRRSVRKPERADDARFVLSVAVFFAVGILADRHLRDYFGRFLRDRPFSGGISFASFVRDTDRRAIREKRARPKYYALGAHGIYWTFSVNHFLNPDSTGVDVENASNALPLLDNEDRDAVFLVWSENRQYLPAIRRMYPGGEEGPYRYGPPGRETEMFEYYRVRREAIDSRRTLEARYRSADGAGIERAEGGPGSVPQPAGLLYPARGEWKGQLFAPAFGRYRFRVESPGTASLALDGASFPVAPDPSSETAVVLARGLHSISLAGPLPDKNARVRLLWAVADSDFHPVPPRFFWSGPPAAFLGEVRWTEGDGPTARESIEYRRDSFLGFRSAERALAMGRKVTAVWKGTLRAPEHAFYGFDAFCNDAGSVSIDGTPVLECRSPDMAPRPASGRAELSAGPHPLEVSYTWTRGFGHLEIYWAPPGAERELLEFPEVSAPGGAWRVGEVKETHPVAPELIGTAAVPPAAPLPPRPAAEKGDRRGCAIDSSGALYVADAGNHRLEVYERSGRLAATWGKGGREKGEFTTAQDVALVGGGRVAVLDSALSRIQVFAPGGALERVIENVGCSPAGIAAGPGGDLFVASPCDSAVRRYSPAGSLLARFTGGADRATRLDQPVDVAVAPDGKLYVADLLNRIVEIDPANDTVRRSWAVHVGTGYGAAKLSFSKGTLYLTDPDREGLFVIETATGRTRALPEASRAAVSEFARGEGLGQCVAGWPPLFDGLRCCAGELLARCADSAPERGAGPAGKTTRPPSPGRPSR